MNRVSEQVEITNPGSLLDNFLQYLSLINIELTHLFETVFEPGTYDMSLWAYRGKLIWWLDLNSWIQLWKKVLSRSVCEILLSVSLYLTVCQSLSLSLSVCLCRSQSVSSKGNRPFDVLPSELQNRVIQRSALNNKNFRAWVMWDGHKRDRQRLNTPLPDHPPFFSIKYYACKYICVHVLCMGAHPCLHAYNSLWIWNIYMGIWVALLQIVICTWYQNKWEFEIKWRGMGHSRATHREGRRDGVLIY